MWCQSSNKTTTSTSIPPNLLKNFNVYEVLEPRKTGATNREETNVDKLIDIDDCSQDSGYQDSDLNALVLDNNGDFNLVDLYQNILVSPQHIKHNVASGVVTNVESNVLDVDFKQFFDKLESGQKIDWTQGANIEEESVSKRDFDVLLEKPRVLIPKVFTEPDADPEDLINEILTQKNIEKRVLQEINHLPDVADIPKNKTKSEVISDYSHLSLYDRFSKDSKFESINNENMASSSTKQCPVDSQINNSLTFTVRAMQKDEKVYKKKRLVRPEHQTSRFTKGPDINEKTVVLPQIMARIMARQEYLDDINSQKKRLILDAGEKVVKTDSQGILNGAEKKRPKNISFGTNVHNSSQSLTLTEAKLCMNKATESIAVHNTVITCLNCNKKTENGILGANSVRLDRNPTLNETKLYTQQATASLAANTANTTTNFNNPSVNKGTRSSAGTSIKADKDFGKVFPKVLMADCNKERLKALEQSKMFRNFVLNGKF